MNRRIIAWMLASCMVMSMSGPALAEAADSTPGSEITETDGGKTGESGGETSGGSQGKDAETNEGEKDKSSVEGTDAGGANESGGQTGKEETGSAQGGQSEAEKPGPVEDGSGKTENDAAQDAGGTGNSQTDGAKDENGQSDATTPGSGTDEKADTDAGVSAIDDAGTTTTPSAAALTLNEVPDGHLLEAIQTACKSEDDYTKLTSLTLTGKPTQVLTGLDLLTGLETLDISNNNITDLSQIHGDKLPNLKTLKAGKNPIED